MVIIIHGSFRFLSNTEIIAIRDSCEIERYFVGKQKNLGTPTPGTLSLIIAISFIWWNIDGGVST